MLRAFDPDSGRLPPGEHVASWDEVVERFGWTERRRRSLARLCDIANALGVTVAQHAELKTSAA